MNWINTPCIRKWWATLFVAVTVACAQAPGVTTDLSPHSRSAAVALLDQAKQAQEAGDLETAAQKAAALVDGYPRFDRSAEALFVAGLSFQELGKHAEAARYFAALAQDYPLSPYRRVALLSGARSFSAIELYERSAQFLLEALGTPLEPEDRDEALGELRHLVRTKLSPLQLEALVKESPSSPVSQEIALHLACQAYARGDYDDCYEMLAEYLYRFPEEQQAPEARRLLKLSSERRAAPRTETGLVNPNAVGVIMPITGRVSLYGRYFQQGFEKALAEFNAANSREVTLVKADSKGNPIDAVKAVRKLVSQDGVIGILGSVFTTPTIAASVEANAWGVSLLSPVVSVEDLPDVGPWIFQTKVPLQVEASAVAEAGVRQLLMERVAVIAPDRGERHAVARFFASEVERLGAEVVAMQFYEEGATDFREQIELVREEAPDAIFIPGAVEAVLLILPQVKFYDLQVQLLGLSNWNSEKLLRLSRDELEGALFPLQTYHGEDRDAYRAFKLAFQESADANGELNPVTVAGYFGMKLLLRAIANGASDRHEVRAFLDAELRRGAEQRLAEARSLTLVTVRAGRTREFRPSPLPQE